MAKNFTYNVAACDIFFRFVKDILNNFQQQMCVRIWTLDQNIAARKSKQLGFENKLTFHVKLMERIEWCCPSS